MLHPKQTGIRGTQQLVFPVLSATPGIENEQMLFRLSVCCINSTFLSMSIRTCVGTSIYVTLLTKRDCGALMSLSKEWRNRTGPSECHHLGITECDAARPEDQVHET